MGESDSVMVDRTSNSLYLKSNDICGSFEKQITDFDLIDTVKHAFGVDLLYDDLDRNLWRVYLKSTKAVSGSSHKKFISNMYLISSTMRTNELLEQHQ